MDGPVEEPNGDPSLDSAVHGPWFSWIGDKEATIKPAIRRVVQVIAAEGPFDGIYGFSQGAVVAISLLSILHAAQDGGARRPLVRSHQTIIDPDSEYPCRSDLEHPREGAVPRIRGSSLDRFPGFCEAEMTAEIPIDPSSAAIRNFIFLKTMGVLKSTVVRVLNFERNSEIASNGVHPAESAED